jgi:hypothetical protein
MHQLRKRQEGKGGVFTGEASKSVFAFLVAIHESGDKLGKLLMVLRFRDEAVPRVTHRLVATQGVGSEVAKDKDQDFIY